MPKESPEKELAMADDRTPVHAARSLTDATTTDNYLESFAAINTPNTPSSPGTAHTAGTASEDEEIRRLAHQYSLERAPHEGSPEEDWLRAENELRHRRNSAVRQGGIEPLHTDDL